MALAAKLLAGSGVGVCSVVGFPLGATTPDVKGYETRRAIFDGAREIDMVINVGALKSGDLQVTAFSTGEAPGAVNAAGFIPVACFADQNGDFGDGYYPIAHSNRDEARVSAAKARYQADVEIAEMEHTLEMKKAELKKDLLEKEAALAQQWGGLLIDQVPTLPTGGRA